jgi:hypothetical protein
MGALRDRHNVIQAQMRNLVARGVIEAGWYRVRGSELRWHFSIPGGASRALTTGELEEFILGVNAGILAQDRHYLTLIADTLRAEAERVHPDQKMRHSEFAGLRLAFHDALYQAGDFRRGQVSQPQFLTSAQPSPTAYMDRIEALRNLPKNQDCDPADCTDYASMVKPDLG